MNINQALKLKKKLTKEISIAYSRVSTYNSIEKDTIGKYDAEKCLAEADRLTKELIDLKNKIYKANQNICHKIFEMAELKGKVINLRSINTREGKHMSGGYGSTLQIEYIVKYDVVAIDQMIKETEEKIEKLQNELDYYNATTEI